jgi:hypothetical protein
MASTPWREGIEAIVLRTVNDQPTLWDSILPPEVLVLPVELGQVDALLNDPVFFGPFAAHILDHNVEAGNPADAPQLVPAIARITADRGYGQASVERDLRDLGNQRGDATHDQTQRGMARVRTPARLPRQREWRTGSEGRIKPHQTKLRLEPHRTHRHQRSPNLVRTRRLGPQRRQDRHVAA